MDCPAKVIMRDVVFFTGFKVSNSTERSYIPTYTAFQWCRQDVQMKRDKLCTG